MTSFPCRWMAPGRIHLVLVWSLNERYSWLTLRQVWIFSVQFLPSLLLNMTLDVFIMGWSLSRPNNPSIILLVLIIEMRSLAREVRARSFFLVWCCRPHYGTFLLLVIHLRIFLPTFLLIQLCESSWSNSSLPLLLLPLLGLLLLSLSIRVKQLFLGLFQPLPCNIQSLL